jgi:hypothetical protein
MVVTESRSVAWRATVAAVFALLPSARVVSPATPPTMAKITAEAGGP